LQALGSQAEYKDTVLSYVSTCDEPEWARECLHKFELEVEQCKSGSGSKHTMHTLVAHHEIYKAYSKQSHFKKLQAKTLIEFEEMLFFDNQMNNIHDVSMLGVHCVYCPEGMTDRVWEDGLAEWRKKRAKAKK
jgi:magnesium-dependent phosphatase 1